MFLYKSETCGLIIDVKCLLGALDKRLSKHGAVGSLISGYSPFLPRPLLLPLFSLPSIPVVST